RDAKYKAKSAIDTVLVRLGDLGSTGLVFLGVHLGMHVFGFAVVNVVAGMIWIGLAVLLRRRQAALAAASGMRAATAVVPAVVPASAPQGPGDQRIVGAVLR